MRFLCGIMDGYTGQLRDCLLDDDQAKDIVQEIFIDLWNRRDSSDIQSTSAIPDFCGSIQGTDHLRDGKVQARHLALMERIQFVNQTEDAINVQELNQSLQLALLELSPRCKEVFELSRFENLTYKQIAGRLGITPKTVEVQIHKALVLLRKKLDKAVIIAWTIVTLCLGDEVSNQHQHNLPV